MSFNGVFVGFYPHALAPQGVLLSPRKGGMGVPAGQNKCQQEGTNSLGYSSYISRRGALKFLFSSYFNRRFSLASHPFGIVLPRISAAVNESHQTLQTTFEGFRLATAADRTLSASFSTTTVISVPALVSVSPEPLPPKFLITMI